MSKPSIVKAFDVQSIRPSKRSTSKRSTSKASYQAPEESTFAPGPQVAIECIDRSGAGPESAAGSSRSPLRDDRYGAGAALSDALPFRASLSSVVHPWTPPALQGLFLRFWQGLGCCHPFGLWVRRVGRWP
jgi:hypothetical protein